VAFYSCKENGTKGLFGKTMFPSKPKGEKRLGRSLVLSSIKDIAKLASLGRVFW
jgi:hypothetical protein